MRSPNITPTELHKRQQRHLKTSSSCEATYDYNDEPIGKVFTDKKFIDPLHDLLVKNQQRLSRIRIDLPHFTLHNHNQLNVKNEVGFPIFEDEPKPPSKVTSSKISKQTGKSYNMTIDDGDNLACHANNILRMAIDSTMMSSMNSITLQNVNGESFDENAYPKDNGAYKIEINEDEIRAAING